MATSTRRMVDAADAFAHFDYDPNLDTMGGMVGRWSLEFRDASGESVGVNCGDKRGRSWGMMAGLGQVQAEANRVGVTRKRWVYTDRARKAAWAAFRRKHK